LLLLFSCDLLLDEDEGVDLAELAAGLLGVLLSGLTGVLDSLFTAGDFVSVLAVFDEDEDGVLFPLLVDFGVLPLVLPFAFLGAGVSGSVFIFLAGCLSLLDEEDLFAVGLGLSFFLASASLNDLDCGSALILVDESDLDADLLLAELPFVSLAVPLVDSFLTVTLALLDLSLFMDVEDDEVEVDSFLSSGFLASALLADDAG
jgi:hypothetical protein